MSFYLLLQAGGKLLLQAGGGALLLQSQAPTSTIGSVGKTRKRRRNVIEVGSNFPVVDDSLRKIKRRRANEAMMVLLH